MKYPLRSQTMVEMRPQLSFLFILSFAFSWRMRFFFCGGQLLSPLCSSGQSVPAFSSAFLRYGASLLQLPLGPLRSEETLLLCTIGLLLAQVQVFESRDVGTLTCR